MRRGRHGPTAVFCTLQCQVPQWQAFETAFLFGKRGTCRRVKLPAVDPDLVLLGFMIIIGRRLNSSPSNQVIYYELSFGLQLPRTPGFPWSLNTEYRSMSRSCSLCGGANLLLFLCSDTLTESLAALFRVFLIFWFVVCCLDLICDQTLAGFHGIDNIHVSVLRS